MYFQALNSYCEDRSKDGLVFSFLISGIQCANIEAFVVCFSLSLKFVVDWYPCGSVDTGKVAHTLPLGIPNQLRSEHLMTLVGCVCVLLYPSFTPIFSSQPAADSLVTQQLRTC